MASPRPRVAIARRAFARTDATNVHPDADWPHLSAALNEAGADATSVGWDQEDVDWGHFHLVVINSTWDSVDRPQEYLAWVRRIARSTTVMNPTSAIEWNIDKVYLRALESRGVAIVPTEWVTDEVEWEPPRYEFVVKPSISAGGRETARYQPEQAPAAITHLRRLLGRGQTVMVQPYLSTVDTEGEVKLVFMEGEFSHAVRVGPLLAAGAGVTERPWERPVAMEAIAPTAAQLEAAHEVLAAVRAEVDQPLLYARVDLVAAPTGEPLLGEVEVVDPSLFLRLAPPAADRYAAAITSRARDGWRRETPGVPPEEP